MTNESSRCLYRRTVRGTTTKFERTRSTSPAGEKTIVVENLAEKIASWNALLYSHQCGRAVPQCIDQRAFCVL
jgi:hypothetical protein